MAVGPHVYSLFKQAVDRGDVLRIDSAGILDHRLEVGTIPWEQVAQVRRHGAGLFVTVRNPEALGLKRSLWSRMNKPIGLPGNEEGVFVIISGLDIPAKRIIGAVESGLWEFRGIRVTI